MYRDKELAGAFDEEVKIPGDKGESSGMMKDERLMQSMGKSTAYDESHHITPVKEDASTMTKKRLFSEMMEEAEGKDL